MPLINVHLSCKKIPNSCELLKELSHELAKSTGKPEKYVMSILQTDVPMLFSGTNDPCCYIEIKSIGSLKPPEMTEIFSEIIEKNVGIPPERIYIGFEDIEASKWGYNRQTFG